MENDRIRLLVVGLALVALVVFLNNKGELETQQVDLKLDISSTSGNWFRDTNDLPIFRTSVVIDVWNIGNKKGEDVNAYIYQDGELDGTLTFDVYTDEHFIENYIISVEYDDTARIDVKVILGDEEEEDTEIITANLPRYITVRHEPIFITPDDPEIISLKDEIIRGKIIHWTALRSWVGSNVEYETDSVQFGENDYWQLSRETIQNGVGDCEDVAILLCTLLRAEGYESDKVFVVVGGQNDEISHAWVTVKILGVWVNLEPTAGGIIQSPIADLGSLLREKLGVTYKAYKFNDEEFIILD